MQVQQAPYAIKEAALIFESGSQQYLDLVIGVYAPEALRIQRVMHRDQITREEVKARISKQIDETMKMRLCDYVITNDDLQDLLTGEGGNDLFYFNANTGVKDKIRDRATSEKSMDI